MSPFDDWARNADINSDMPFAPPSYADCWHIALARMACVLNCEKEESIWASDILRRQDPFILDHIRSIPNLEKFYVIEVGLLDQTKIAEAMKIEDIASNFFYGNLEINTNETGTHRIVYRLTEAFLKYSYQGLHLPQRLSGELYTNESLGYQADELPERILQQCASNYLIRNLWHNFAHVHCQGINSANYHQFRGDGRFETDFDADNLSLILLASSYGLPVSADRIDQYKPLQSMIHLLRRNRCNSIFRLRAADRNEVSNPQETAWRIRRTISGYLSGWLLAQGTAVASIGVYLNNPAQGAQELSSLGARGFSISLNGAWFSYEDPLPSSDQPDERLQYFHDLATNVLNDYRKRLRENPSFREYARNSLENFFIRCGIKKTLSN